MNLDYSKKYYRTNDVERLQEDEKILYVNYNSTEWFRTNIDGAQIIDKCDGTRSLYDIIKDRAEKDGFSIERLMTTMTPFLKKCIDKGILVEENSKKEVELYDTLNIDYPNDIWIHVSNKCNLACPFCYSNSSSGGEQYVDVNKVLNFLKGVPENHREGIIISGGEPFLYPHLVELVKGIKELKYSNINIITNGTVGEEKYAAVIPCINSLQISLDGSTEEIHDITRGQGSFKKVCKNIELAKNYNVDMIYCSVTPTKHNVKDIQNIPQFAFEHDLDFLHVTRLMPIGRGKTNLEELYPDEEEYNDALLNFLKNLEEVNRVIFYNNSMGEIQGDNAVKRDYINVTISADQSSKVIQGGRRLSCGLGTLVSIGYDSKIYPCPSLAFPEFQIGDLDDNFNDIMKKINDFANQYNVNNCNEDCKTCKIKYFCGGGCKACTYGLGDICSKDPSCEYYKESINNILWNYVSRD